jgi:hypothetical protein
LKQLSAVPKRGLGPGYNNQCRPNYEIKDL